MSDWLNKFFAIVTMYNTNHELDELQTPDEEVDEATCPLCGGSSRALEMSQEERECELCGRRLNR